MNRSTEKERVGGLPETDESEAGSNRTSLWEVLDELPVADEKDLYRQFMPTAPLSMTEAAPDEVWAEDDIYWHYRVMARQEDGTMEPRELVYELDLQDAETNRRYRAALEAFKADEPEDSDEAKDVDNVEMIETFWGAVRDFFDALLGPDAGEAIVGKKANLRKAFRAYDSIIAFGNRQKYQMGGAYGGAMARFRTNRSVNRAQKRQQAKKAQQGARKPPVKR